MSSAEPSEPGVPDTVRTDASKAGVGPPAGLAPGVRAMLISAAAFSVMSALVRALGERIPSVEIAFVRAVITLVLSAVALRRAGLSAFGSGKTPRRWLVARGLIGFVGLHCYFYAVTTLPLADATTLHFLNPLLVALLAPVALGEPLRRRDLVGVVLGLAGVVLVARPSAIFGPGSTGDATPALPPLGLLAALGGACAGAAAYLVVRRLRTEDPRVVVLQFPLLGVPLTLPLVVPLWVWPSAWEWALLLVMGVFTQIGQVKMTEGLQLERAARATAVSYAQIPFSIALGIIFFGELPTTLGLVGAACIVLGTLSVAQAGERGVAPAR